jgi:hypothetical protein
MRPLDEHKLDGEQVLDGKLLKVFRDRVQLPDGSEGMREYVKHPGACVIIAESRPGVLVFERQYRYPVGRQARAARRDWLHRGELATPGRDASLHRLLG